MLIFITSITIGIVIIYNNHSFKVNEYSNKTNSKLDIGNFNQRIIKSSRQPANVFEESNEFSIEKISF